MAAGAPYDGLNGDPQPQQRGQNGTPPQQGGQRQSATDITDSAHSFTGKSARHASACKDAAAAAAGHSIKPSKLQQQYSRHSKPGYLSPAAAAMASKQSSAHAPGRKYRDAHIACCPCIESQSIFKDQVFDYDGWQRHKSWRRHGPNLWICLQVVLYYWPPLLVVLLISIVAGLWHTFLRPRGWPDITDSNFLAPFSLMSFVLSLLLIFRTNSAYGRWWEARIQWGTVVRVSRDIMRQTMTFAGLEDGYLIDMIARWTIALPYVLKAHVTELADLSAQLRGVLLPHELQYLHDCKHRPNAVCQALSDAVNALDCHPYKSMQINKQVSELMQMTGGMERLYRQPIPSSYTRHTSRFLVIWSIFLPFGLWKSFQWLTPAVAVTVTFLLLGVENIGIQIEQPFSVLPLELFCATARANVIEQLKTRPRGGDLVYQAASAWYEHAPSPHPPADLLPPSPQAVSRHESWASADQSSDGTTASGRTATIAAAAGDAAHSVQGGCASSASAGSVNGPLAPQAVSTGRPLVPPELQHRLASGSWAGGSGSGSFATPRRLGLSGQGPAPEDVVAEEMASAEEGTCGGTEAAASRPGRLASVRVPAGAQGDLPLPQTLAPPGRSVSWHPGSDVPRPAARHCSFRSAASFISGREFELLEAERCALEDRYTAHGYGA